MYLSRQHLNKTLLLFLCVLCYGASAATVSTPAPIPVSDVCILTERRCEESGGRTVCSGGLLQPPEAAPPTFNLKLCNWPDPSIDPHMLLPGYTSLLELSISAIHDVGTERAFSRVFPLGLSLEVLNVSRLGLASLQPTGLLDALAGTLRTLDVSHNRLLTLPLAALLPLTLLQSSLFTGNPWHCGVEMAWLLDQGSSVGGVVSSRISDVSSWACGPDLYPGKPVLPVMVMLKTLRTQCPSRTPYNCTCELTNVVWGSAEMVGDSGGHVASSAAPPAATGDGGISSKDAPYLIPVTTVNCSARGLYRMPHYLPVNTTTLLLTKNMISDVRPLANNPHYRRVMDIFLEQNQVRSIAALEGSEWLSTFRVLSLRNNQLSQIPTYALDHAFQKNRNFAQLYLGNNPWTCDCMFTPGFQNLLAKYQAVVRDVSDIRCALKPDDENSQEQIRALSRSLLCREPHEAALSGLDILNAALALLIVLVLGKLAYDYWAFKTSGRLPWLVAKMP